MPSQRALGDSGISPAVAARLRDVHLALADTLLAPDGCQTVLAAVEQLFELRLSAITRPVRIPGGGWDFEILEARGLGDGTLEAYRAFCSATAGAFQHFDPLRPEPEQRNQVAMMKELLSQRGTSPMVTQGIPTLGLAGCDQLRALICDGPLLLGWVGGFRERAFEEEDRRALQALVPRLRSWLLVQRMLHDTQVHPSRVSAALDEIPAPALLLDGKQRIVHANALARCDSTLEDAQRDPRPVGWHTAEVALPGEPKHQVAICFATAALESRLERAALEWKLSRRQRDVIRLLVRGDANKRIAEKLCLSEVTVEAHVTSILKRSRAESRTDLAARVWSGAWEGLR
jgi:DNA-binding CsgD family transcriptional regulator